MTTPVDGSYRLVLDPSEDHAGTQTLRIKDKSTDDTPIPVATDDTAIAIAFTPDTNPRMSFTAQAGHRYRVQVPTSTLTAADRWLRVYAPDGTTAIEQPAGPGGAWYIESAQTGTYRIVIDPDENSGTTTLRIADITDVQLTPTTDGNPTTLSLQPRQNAQLSLTATAGDQYRISVSSSDLRFPPDRRGIDNGDRDAREADEVRPGVP